MRYNKHLKDYTGTGRILKGDEPISTVLYTLSEQQVVIKSTTFSGTSENDGKRFFTGNITVLEGEKDLIGKGNFTLNMQDGQKISFFVKGFSSNRNSFDIQPSGAIF